MDSERLRARGEYEELKLKAAQEHMGAREARESLAEAIAIYHDIDTIDAVRVTFLTAQLVKGAADLKDTFAKMECLRERYGF
jgi:hypothetical protein